MLASSFVIFVDNIQFLPELQEGHDTTFVTMDFVGTGKHKIEIFGTTYLDIFEINDVIDYEIYDGYVDDVNGWNAYNSNGNISSDGHGTHVAGTVGAEGNSKYGSRGLCCLR